MPLSANNHYLSQETVAWGIPDYLKDLMATEPRITSELVALYLEDTTANFTLLKKSLQFSDPGPIRMTLHAMKGSCRQIGGLTLGDMIEQMEARLQNGQIDAIRTGVPDLESSFALLRREMERFLSTPANRGS
jgi:hypothetical protein